MQESTCIVRPEADNARFLLPLAEKILKAADACPTTVIKYETGEVAATAAAPAPSPKAQAPKPATDKPAAKPAGQPTEARSAAAKPAAEKPAAKPAKAAPPPKPKILRKDPGELPDPFLQAVAFGLPAPRDPAASEARRAATAIAAAGIPADAPPDMRAAILATAGAYAPSATLEQHIKASKGRMLWHKLIGRKVNVRQTTTEQR
ncbi:MAG: hypothetical protein ACHRHE_11665 [Tepidisphaerales bacterium]